MQNKDAFSGYHPLVNFLFFALVLGATMVFMHPVSLCISLAGALGYSIYLKGWKRGSLPVLLPMMLMAAILNPAFNHEGMTILTYLPSGNPLTLESIAYGIAAGGMLAAVILWFSCYTEVMTSDKFVYLFGRILPALSLLLSMTLRFVPRFKAQFHVVQEAQKCVGRDISNGSILSRMKHTVTIFSIMVTWALENAIEMADSMKSRGYGLPGRTAFSIYRFEERDKIALLWLLFCGCYIGCGAFLGGLKWRYFPTIQGVALTPWTVSLHLVYLALCYTPVALDRREDWKWKYLKYEI
ncbi:MAG: energy-coupling factor transporter transmembrane protein EcfT [Bacteroidales bacterium]|nr:energy-coupling factor transporter transmembrane component T [Anaerotignum sp.]MCI5679925.1 energy-coupling factor transporter transmembrane protein EcfT [Bacteroidales bacterium]MDY3926481.1 energy-coupling factor transporter transmembrane component T [Anaerotignum sp.]